MKATEIMPLDHVLYHGRVIIVTAIDVLPHSIRGVYANDGEDTGWISEDEIEPINLSEEILLANGFEFNKGRNIQTTFYYLKANDTSFILRCIPRPFSLHTMIMGKDIYINYVHELQRVLRCCGLFDLANNFEI